MRAGSGLLLLAALSYCTVPSKTGTKPAPAAVDFNHGWQFVYASVVDAEGTVLPEARAAVRFAAAGGAELIGDNPERAEADIATILLKTGASPVTIQVTASSAIRLRQS
ncbi:hypothetical protein BEN47_17835 [Hymenobacter lapidarius]|uniref:Uncharacterized protein n=1 Tax=Hymenobacter lapidarius TaxID=1908237 RepID=A0A1G1SX11_9BACT|nr:hypothetical protein BEN47_17835 [Hymenobacter lapidarius]